MPEDPNNVDILTDAEAPEVIELMADHMENKAGSTKKDKVRNMRKDVSRRVTQLNTQNQLEIANIIHLNMYYKEYSATQYKLLDFCPGHMVVKQDLKLFKINRFEWKAIGYFEERKVMMNQYESLQDSKGVAFLRVRPFIKTFPLRLIRKYIMTPFQQLNFEYYNMSLSYLNFIMLGLLEFYVNYDLRFSTRIHSRDAQSMDPFYRQFVRNNLQSNRLICSKYLDGAAKLTAVSQ